VGTPEGLEARVAAAEGIAFRTVATGKVRRSSNPLKSASPANVRDTGRVPLGAVLLGDILREHGDDTVLDVGRT
jgi:UDP-N-acetylglucosamine--N-acetylmuramyl-(pentapeptide) pyrophosphoryl-undecaprenol N-acetylglucosamine transferase